MKTMFGRQFFMTASLILACILLLGISFRVFIHGYIAGERQEALHHNAQAVANLAAAYESGGTLENNWDFRINLTFAADAAGTDTLICAPDGRVILCSCGQLSCEHIGMNVSPEYVQQVVEAGKLTGTGVLQGLYDDSRYVVSVPIYSGYSQGLMGIVIASTERTEVSGLIGQVTDIFVLTGTAVLLFALVAISALTRSTSLPLKTLASAARRFGHGELDVRVELDESNPEEITELALAFNNMAQSLEKSEQQREEFVANVSHELKTPMTTIAGFMDGMLDGTIPPEEHRHYMQVVADEVRRLSRLVRSMLDISRLQSQGIPDSKKTVFDVCETAGSVLITFEQKINQKALDVQVELPEEPIYTWAERDAITQVIYNLLDNAVKFCQTEGVLGLKVQPEERKIFVSISNTGLTIPEQELSLIFDRFHKTDKSRSVDRDGVGLGLYIVKTIILSHGEDIRVTSRDGVTEFTGSLTVAG